MTFLELRNLTYKFIKEQKKEEIAFFYLIQKYSKLGKRTLINLDNSEIDFDFKTYKKDLDLYLKGKPIKKIIGYINIFNVKISLKYNVLIPRLETEELIDYLIKHLKGNERVLDLCCGSGVIGLVLKNAHPNTSVFMSDIDDNSIKQSKMNAKINNLDVKIIKSDLFENIKDKFDVIICNPPYINKSDILDESVLKYEPYNSLFADNSGLEFYDRIIPKIKEYLIDPEKYFIAFEIGENQDEYIANKLKNEGFNSIIMSDLNNMKRFIISKK